MSEIRNVKAKAIGVAGCFTLLQDLLQPMAPFAGFVAAISAISTLLLFVAYLFVQLGENWKTALLLSSSTLVLSTGLWGFQQYFDANGTGIIAKEVPVISEFQRIIGIAEDIKIDIGEIKENTEETANNTGDTVAILSGTKGSSQVILKNRGISWNRDSFNQAVIAGDIETVTLFLDGGFSANLYVGTNQNFFLQFIHESTSDHFNGMVKLLASKGVIIPNKPLNIYTMGSFSNSGGDIPFSRVSARFYKYFITDPINASTSANQKKLRIYQQKNTRKMREDIKNGKAYTPLPMPNLDNYSPPSYLITVSLLTLAVWNNDENKINTLLSIGEDPRFQGKMDATDNKSPTITPISEAKLFSNKEIVKLLKTFNMK